MQPERNFQEAADQHPGKKCNEIGHDRCQGRTFAAHPKDADEEDIQPDIHQVCRNDHAHGEKGLTDDGQKIGDVCQCDPGKDEPAQVGHITIKVRSQLIRAAEGPGKSGTEEHQPHKQDQSRGKCGEHGGGKVSVRPFLLLLRKILRIQQRPANPRDGIDHGGHKNDRRTEIDNRKGILTQKPPDDHTVRKFTQGHAHGGQQRRYHIDAVFLVEDRRTSFVSFLI